ncbi:DCC1-like thiol-disulfide oxidoreductase family protein [soil metagenome]
MEKFRPQIEGRDLILYDGVCALCNGVVHYLLKHDPQGRFRFIPQETALAQQLLALKPGTPQQEKEGVILIATALTPTQHIYRRSDAVAHALTLLGGPSTILGRLTRLIPRPLREFGYGLIARFRYRLFGRYPTCPIPTPDQRSRILGLP